MANTCLFVKYRQVISNLINYMRVDVSFFIFGTINSNHGLNPTPFISILKNQDNFQFSIFYYFLINDWFKSLCYYFINSTEYAKY